MNRTGNHLSPESLPLPAIPAAARFIDVCPCFAYLPCERRTNAASTRTGSVCRSDTSGDLKEAIHPCAATSVYSSLRPFAIVSLPSPEVAATNSLRREKDIMREQHARARDAAAFTFDGQR